MNSNPMIAALLDLTQALHRDGPTLILAGGFGLYLWQSHLQLQPDLRTRIAPEFWPYPRATEDLDLFLPTQLIVSLTLMKELRTALDSLGFAPVEEAKFLHFSKPVPSGGRIKIDMLTGPIGTIRDELKLSPPRVRPRGDLQLHAYLVDEAVDFEKSLRIINLHGTDSSGNRRSINIHIPQPFTFLLMKLHAFRDRRDDARRDLGQHHALDVYRIIAMLTDIEYRETRDNIQHHANHPAVIDAREIARNQFGSPTAIGILRLREHPLFTNTMPINILIDDLADLFR